MTAQRIKKLTVEEYVELEQATNTKHEYHNGEVFALASIQSFQEYALIAQDKPTVEIFYRNKESEDWQNFNIEGLDNTFGLQSLQIDIEMKALYERVVF